MLSVVVFFCGVLSDMSNKRKKLCVSVEEKYRAIKRIDNGESAKKIALELGVGTSTVSDWRKKSGTN